MRWDGRPVGRRRRRLAHLVVFILFLGRGRWRGLGGTAARYGWSRPSCARLGWRLRKRRAMRRWRRRYIILTLAIIFSYNGAADGLCSGRGRRRCGLLLFDLLWLVHFGGRSMIEHAEAQRATGPHAGKNLALPIGRLLGRLFIVISVCFSNTPR